MSEIVVVENPRKKKRRKAAPKRRRKSTRRRKNPTLATYVASNPRRRKNRTPKRRNTYIRRRNPGRGLMKMFDMTAIIGVASGVFTARYSAQLIGMISPAIPTTGMTGTIVKVGTVLAVGSGLKFFGASSKMQSSFIAGGLGYCLLELADQFVAPALGLSGYYNENEYLTYDNYDAASDLSGYNSMSAAGLQNYGSGYTDPVLAA